MKTPIVLAGLSLFLATGCGSHKCVSKHPETPPAADNARSGHPGPNTAVAVLKPTQGNNVSGTVTFVQKDGHIEVSARVTGLAPGKHGFHIHQYGDCSDPAGKSAGGHFNPAGHPHAGPASAKRHVGDLGNLTADKNGSASLQHKDGVLKLTGPHSILGRGVIVHAKADDLKSQPTGAAGARVACGVIGTAKK